ncbi:MAG: hypothetical protein V1692_02845, partial [bacterium]
KFLRGRILKYSHKPLCSTSGIIRFIVKPGDVVKVGQPLAKVYNVLGKPQETLLALEDGILLGHSDSSVSLPGLSVVAFGII